MSDAAYVRIGLVGIGGICKGTHIPGLKSCKNVKITALCDIDPEKMKPVAAEFGIDEAHCFTDYRDLIACGDVDAVDITTPNDSHVEIGLAAVAAGKPFNIEKPVGMNAAEVKKLRDAAVAANVPAAVCFSYRYVWTARQTREMIRQDKIGPVRNVYVKYLQGWANPEKDCPCIWRFKKDKSGSGALGDLGSHMLDLVRFMLGEEYVELSAQLGTFTHRRKPETDNGEAYEPVDVDDYAHFLARTESGTSVVFQISRNAFGRGNYQQIEIYGDKGAIRYTLDGGGAIEVCFPGDEEKNGRFDRLPAQEYPHTQMQAFLDLIRGIRTEACASLEDGHMNQIYLDCILKAAEERRTLSL